MSRSALAAKLYLGPLQLRRSSVIVVLAVIASFFDIGSTFSSSSLSFDVEMASSTADTAQLFFDIGAGYNERDSSAVTLPNDGAVRTYRFPLPAKKIHGLRFDVLQREGRVTIRSAAVTDGWGHALRSFRAADFTPHSDLRIASQTAWELTLETAPPSPGATLDPIVSVSLPTPFNPEATSSTGAHVLRFGVWFALLAVATVVGGVVHRHPHFRDAERVYRAVILGTTAFTLVHTAAFTLVVSYDGMEYVHLAGVLFSDRFPSQWNAVRTPGFPLLLKCAFFAGGAHSQMVVLVTTAFGLGGILLLGATARRMAGALAGSTTLVILAFYPVLIGYQHTLLTETSTFFFMALVIRVLVGFWYSGLPNTPWLYPCGIVGALACGYYFRPTILYMSPLVLMLFVFTLASHPSGPRWADVFGRPWNRGLIIKVAFVALGPWLIAYPWQRLVSERTGSLRSMVFSLGAYKQMLFPPDHPALSDVRAEYDALLKEESRRSRLLLDGLPAGGHYDLSVKVAAAAGRVGFGNLIRENPAQYGLGVLRSMLFFLGLPGHPEDDENGNFSRAVFALWPPEVSLDKAPGWNRELKQFPAPQSRPPAFFGKVFLVLLPAYRWLVLCGAVTSVVWLIVSIRRREGAILTITVIPLAFLFMHAITLVSEGRYAFPVYPIFLTVLVLCGHMSWRVFMKSRSRAHPTTASITEVRVPARDESPAPTLPADRS